MAQSSDTADKTEAEPSTDDTQDADDPWQTWERGGRKFVTVRKDGTIAPNSAALESYFEDAEAVVLRKHESKDIIGLLPKDEYEENDDTHYKVTGSEHASIAGRLFLKAHGLFPDESRRYVPEWNEDAGLLTLDLGEEGEIVSQSSSSED